MIAETSSWVLIVVALIGACVPVVGTILVVQLRTVKAQAAWDAAVVKEDSDKYAAQQTKEHNTVIELLKTGIVNDARLEGKVEGVGDSARRIERKIDDHVVSPNPHPQAKEN